MHFDLSLGTTGTSPTMRVSRHSLMSLETVIYVGDLARTVTVSQLEEVFSVYGKLVSCDIVEDVVTK